MQIFNLSSHQLLVYRRPSSCRASARARDVHMCARVHVCTPGFEMDTVSAAAGDDSEISGLCEHVIRGVSVTFPFDPYSCQLVYMEKVIHALQEV